MGYLVTYSGEHYDPVTDSFSKINITDIAHSLSHICRANGHCRIFYSVAQHCIACAAEAAARGYSERIQLACLLHDASETYLSDVIRPLKGILTAYHELEDRMMEYIWTTYTGDMLSEEEQDLVFGIDDDMLEYEFHNIMAEDLNEQYKRKILADIRCVTRDCDEVADEFLKTFRDLQEKLEIEEDVE